MENVDNDLSLKSFIEDSIQFYFTLLKYIKDGCKYYWKYSFLLLIVIGIFFYYKSSKIQTYYTAKSSYIFNYSFKKFYGETFHYLEQLVANKEYEMLAQTLNIPISSSQTILELNARNVENAPLHEDFSDHRVPFYVFIKITDKKLLPSIQTAFTNHLINDTLSLERIEKTHLDLEKQLVLLNEEIRFLDSIKNQFLDSIPSKKEKNNLTALLQRYEERSNYKINLQNTLENNDAVTLQTAFKAIEHSKNSLLKKAALKYSLLYIVLSLIITTSLFWYKQQFSDES